MSRMSKADEATSWRRPMPSHDHSTPSSSSKTGGSYSHRPASAGGSSAYNRMMQQQQQQQQPPPMRQPVPASFNVVEAQALLDHRWTDICQQGLQLACQCKDKAATDDAAGAADAAADGEDLAGKQASKFLQDLKAAADSRQAAAPDSRQAAVADSSTADGAWDDP